jgi:hypothetical protein
MAMMIPKKRLISGIWRPLVWGIVPQLRCSPLQALRKRNRFR